jgi:Domain of Unknown Function (DUF748)
MSPPWQYRIESIVMENGDGVLEQDGPPQPVMVRIAPFNIRLNGLSDDLAKPFDFEADGGVTRRGIFKISGQITLRPMGGRLQLYTRHIDLASIEPLATYELGSTWPNASITSAKLATNGDLQLQFDKGKFDATYDGRLMVGRVSLSDKLTGISFLRWDALSIDGFEMHYGAPKTRIEIGPMALSAFYARLVLNSDGRLNLSDLFTGPEQPSVLRSQPVTSQPGAAPMPADITVKGLTLHHGELSYRDDFIKPPYSANLRKLEGKVGTFGTNTREPAEVVLAAKVSGLSPASITGSINPLAPMASLDLEGNANRIELPPLTPYAAKYTGYPISGGTLSGDVHYTLANRRLTATNHLILDQLTFGQHVDNPSARNLPVRLAVAVLKDSHGRIDVRIPVSGSLADPNFDLGRVIWQGLEDLIMKAASAPFTVLASAIGGEKQHLAYIEFAPGYSTLAAPSRDKLQKLTVVLTKRPSLKLRITGRVDPKLDRQGLRVAMLDDEIKSEKAKDQQPAVPIEQVELTPDEYVKYLRRVYRAADFAKPRNIVGMVRRLPPDEMRELLLSNVKVDDQDLRHLAEARASAVFKALSTQIDRSRLLIGPPKLNAEGITEGPTTRVDFALE